MKKLFTLALVLASGWIQLQAQAVIYSQDFAGGIPAGWTNSGIPTAAIWTYSTTGTQGGYSSGNVINSATKANGFMLFDSDFYDEGATAGGTGTAAAPHNASLTSSAISCTGYSKVKLTFSSSMRQFQATHIVSYSKDSLTWKSDTIHTDVDVNDASANPTAISLDISSVAANQPKVWIRFTFKGDYYYWMIDDINLIESPNNDLVQTNALALSGTLGNAYAAYPLSQQDSISFGAGILNDGKTTQPNTKATVNVKKAAATVFTANSTPLALAAGADTFVSINGAYLPTGIAAYTAIVNSSSDSVDFTPYNNSDTLTFNVTDSIYSVTTGANLGGVSLYRASQGLTIRAGSLIEVVNPDTVTSVATAFWGAGAGFTISTVPNSQVKAVVYKVDENSIGAGVLTVQYVCSTSVRKVLASELVTNAFKTVNMRIDPKSGNSVLPIGIYLVSLEYVSTDSNILYVTSAVANGGVGAIDITSTTTPASNTNGFVLDNSLVPFMRVNFGHGANLLTCDFSRTPGFGTVKAEQSVKFTGSANNSPASFYWNFGNGDTAIGQTVNYAFPSTGKDTSYNVCLTVVSGGQSTQTCKIVSIKGVQGVGINDVADITNVSFVPNPTSGILNIKADGLKGDFTVRVYNILGSEVKSYNETANGNFNKTYNMSDLANGSYFVKIVNGEKTATKQLVITK